MTSNEIPSPDARHHARVRAHFGPGKLADVGRLAAEAGGTQVLLVTDAGIVRAGYADMARKYLREAGLTVSMFSDVEENPTSAHVAAGVRAAREGETDCVVGLGGGSSMDFAKGINLIYTNGGDPKDYWGYNKATRPLLPMILVPTTAGTGSEAQSYALITDPATHQKMACGDEKLLCTAAILDPDLLCTVPRAVAAATGIDAVAHAVETAVTTKRNEASRELSRDAWSMLVKGLVTYCADRADMEARSRMLLGAHLAGRAIEHSMLGAAHACANPLTARYGIVHGVAVGVMLPHVVRFNAGVGVMPDAAFTWENRYIDLYDDPSVLASALEEMLDAVGIARQLRIHGVASDACGELATSAERQWTGQFNPRPVDREVFTALYRAAL